MNNEIVKSFKSRRPVENQLVKIYRNLGHAVAEKFSIVDPKTGLVIGHTNHVILHDVKFTVQSGGVARANREQRKNVHAHAVGYLQVAATARYLRDSFDARYSYSVPVSYNPYKADHFIRRDLDCRIDEARSVLFADDGKCYAGVNR